MIREGDPTGVCCPQCTGPVVYNGNYFCSDCGWDAPERWIKRHPRAYRFLMDWRARRWGVEVQELQNFNRTLYDAGGET